MDVDIVEEDVEIADNNEKVDVPLNWKEPEFRRSDNPSGLLEESSFATLFPKYREKYLREAWKVVEKKLKNFGLIAKLDCAKGSITVTTSKETYDPYAVVKGRDCIKLLARSVPVQHALKVMEDDITSDIIKINGFIRKKDRFIRRRNRLIGPNGNTLKAIEILTGCYVLVQGSTVSGIGTHRGLSDLRKIVEDCMKNIHPVYNIKMLMIKQELMKNDELKNESWERFLPKFKNKNVKRKKPLKVRVKMNVEEFPPEQMESKIDKELETGEYFINEKKNEEKNRNKKKK